LSLIASELLKEEKKIVFLGLRPRKKTIEFKNHLLLGITLKQEMEQAIIINKPFRMGLVNL